VNDARVISGVQLQHCDVVRLVYHSFIFLQEQAAFVAERIHDDSTAPEIRSLSVFFWVSDVSGYTTLSQQLPASELAQLIGSWHSECNRLIQMHGGIVDKFIGDAVLAYWTDCSPATRLGAAQVPPALAAACAELALTHSAAPMPGLSVATLCIWGGRFARTHRCRCLHADRRYRKRGLTPAGTHPKLTQPLSCLGKVHRRLAGSQGRGPIRGRSPAQRPDAPTSRLRLGVK
jgi:hypothetical protein